MTILVTGARGNMGRHLVSELLDAGEHVRALTRDPAATGFPDEVEVVTGDLTDPDSLTTALSGVRAIQLITSDDKSGAPLETGPRIAELAIAAGVEQVNLLWSGVDGPVERAIEASGLSWTRLRPVELMSNALGWTESIRAHGEVHEAFPAALNASVHPADVGAVAARTLLDDVHSGQSYSITGPAALTVPDKVGQLGTTLGRRLRYVELPRSQARQQMLDRGVSGESADFVLDWHAQPPPEGYTVVPTVEEVTGKPPRTFADWANEHAHLFH